MNQYVKKVSIIGTVGIPAKYGGFETLVDNITAQNYIKGNKIQYTVYCSSKMYTTKLKNYNGASLKYIPLKANGIQSVIYDIISILKAICSGANTLLILGVSGAIILPLIKHITKKKIIVNIDGLEHKRDKWGSKTRQFLKWSEKTAVFNADIVITDNKAIQDYVNNEYNKQSVLIAYGGDHVLCDTSSIKNNILTKYGLNDNKGYCFSVCRIEPENNVHITLEAFKNNPSERIVFVGNWDSSEYGQNLKRKYKNEKNIVILNPIYDLATLNVLRNNCKIYIHGHSAGGTNPSLVEAMFFGKPILTFDVNYNRETTENKASYYTTSKDLSSQLAICNNGAQMLEIANRRYLWGTIACQYEELY